MNFQILAYFLEIIQKNKFLQLVEYQLSVNLFRYRTN